MIRRVKVQGYKSLRNLEVHLQPLSVLFGPNATGKSNFLDCLQLLSRIATQRTVKEAFETPYRGKPLESFSFGPGGIEGLLGQDSASFSIEVDVELSPAVCRQVEREIKEMRGTNGRDKPVAVSRTNLRYGIEIEIRPGSGILRVANESLCPMGKRWQEIDRNPYLERKGQRIHLRMEGQSHPTYYDVGLDHSILSRPHYPPHNPHVTAMRREFERWLFFYLEPRERMRAAAPVKEVHHIGLMGEELAAFLNTLKATNNSQFRNVEKSLHAIIPSITGIRTDVNRMGEVELNLIEGDTPIPARVVSEGTLRLLGLLALSGATETPSVVGFEEPENGIHPRRIRDIAELLRTRSGLGETQVIVTTHSPILPDLIPSESLFVCRKRASETLIEPFSDWGPLSKRNEIDKALDDSDSLPVSQRLLRGDFDA